MNQPISRAADLKPCPTPWCKHSEPFLDQHGGQLTRVKCKICEVKTDLQFSEAAAIDQWNIRATPTHQGDTGLVSQNPCQRCGVDISPQMDTHCGDCIVAVQQDALLSAQEENTRLENQKLVLEQYAEAANERIQVLEGTEARLRAENAILCNLTANFDSEGDQALLLQLEAMYSHRGDGIPTQPVNPDGPDAAKRIRALLMMEARRVETLGRLRQWFAGYKANGGTCCDEEIALIEAALSPQDSTQDARDD